MGTPGICVRSNPTLLTTSPQSICCGSESITFTLCFPASPLNCVRCHRNAEHVPSLPAKTSVGAARKRNQSTRFEVLSRSAKLATILLMISRDRFFGRFVASSFSLASFIDKLSSSGSTTGSTPLTSNSSRNSLLVNAACTTPRLPSTCTVCSPLLCHIPIRSIAASHMSVCRSSPGSFSSNRATSNATLPLPTTAMPLPTFSGSCSISDWWSGWPLYHLTKAGAPITPGASSPGI
mmetsp:Transcript_4868/g.8476  ORF Transcript_4868/g.8476 Transcript_4868/m.8476 type:complete len:236 (+) Transcript_4868:337-1044(+)